MRGVASYVMMGILVVLTLGMSVPAAWLSVKAGPVVQNSALLQSVNRAQKADRLTVPVTIVGKTRAVPTQQIQKPVVPVTPVKILDGCDPVFSPLSSSAQANLPGRCAV